MSTPAVERTYYNDLIDRKISEAVTEGGGGDPAAVTALQASLDELAGSVGEPEGVATLDSTGRVPETQLPVRDLSILKTSPQAVTNSATPVNDDSLILPVAAGETWRVEIFLLAELAAGGGTGTDLKARLTVPAGTTGYWGSSSSWNQPGAAGASAGPLAAITALRNAALTEGIQGVRFVAILTASATGQVQLQWAQETANEAALTVLPGSHISARRLGV